MAATGRVASPAVPAKESVVKTESMLPFEEDPAVNDQDIELPRGKERFTPEELYRFTRIKPFVLRFWESEFPALKPKMDTDGGLSYPRADVEMILAIKKMLYEKGLTLAEARRRLSGEQGVEAVSAAGAGAKREPKSGKKQPRAKEKAASPKTAGRGKVGKAPKKSAEAASAEKGKGRRGLPGEGGPRSRVSFEELLPDNVGPPGENGPAKSPAPAGRAKKAAGEPGPPELRRALAGAVRELRAILTLLRKGDR